MARTAGMKLRAKLSAAVRAAGPGMEFDEYEVEAIDAAVRAADRGEHLRDVFDRELAGEARPTTLARLSAEIRHCERAVVDLVARVSLGVAPPKSARHVRAANARWQRRDKANQPVVDGHVVPMVR